MKSKNVIQLFLALGFVIVILSACVNSSAPTAAVDTSEPGISQEMPTSAPIVGTAISAGSQELPLPTVNIPGEIDGIQIITVDQNGQTLIFQPGDYFMLMLGDGYTWDVSILDPEIVSQARQSAPEDSQGIFEALQTGQTELAASGDPLCLSQRPACLMPSISFTLKIVVE